MGACNPVRSLCRFAIPDDAFFGCMWFLPPTKLYMARGVNRAALIHGESVFENCCCEFSCNVGWQGFLAGHCLLSWAHIYAAAVREGARRTITLAEITHQRGWGFRFKRAAGEGWMALDTYWQCLKTHGIED